MEVESRARLFKADHQAGKGTKRPLWSRMRKRQQETLAETDKEVEEMRGYRKSTAMFMVYWLLVLCSGGIVWLLSRWIPRLYVALSLRPCSLKDADYVLCKVTGGHLDLVPVLRVPMHAKDTATENGPEGLGEDLKMMEYRCHRFQWDASQDRFVELPATPTSVIEYLCKVSREVSKNLPAEQVTPFNWGLEERRQLYGENRLTIPVEPVYMLIFNGMWDPFYVFQYFSIVIWIVGTAYYTYAAVIFVLTWFSIIMTAVSTHKVMKRLAELAQVQSAVTVFRKGEPVMLDSSELVPGDLVVLTPGVIPADMVLIRGECVVDESMLTGESVPVRKVTYSADAEGSTYDPDNHQHCTLMSGTYLSQCKVPRGQVGLALVVRTRFYSAKGSLFRSILLEKEHKETFISDAMRFICLMLLIICMMYIWSALVLHDLGADAATIVLRFFDLVTIAVPPALPAVLVITMQLAVHRLKLHDVYVTRPYTINLAGRLNVVCFDKTGTLTELGLELQGVAAVVEGSIAEVCRDVEKLPSSVIEVMGCCHGLTQVDSDLVGDPLDQKLFSATGWQMKEEDAGEGSTSGLSDKVYTWLSPPPTNGEVPEFRKIIRRFEFSSTLQRNVVVVGCGDKVLVVAKGSPEMIRTLVVKESLPQGFDQGLERFTCQGLRVLALAVGEAGGLSIDELLQGNQQQVEARVSFQLVGLAVLSNQLRPDTPEVIRDLQDADIRCAMVTGDHLRTAIYVAQECGIMNEARPVCVVDDLEPEKGLAVQVMILRGNGDLDNNVLQAEVLPKVLMGEMECAVTGRGFRKLQKLPDADVMSAILARASVFARMTPDDKRDIVQLLGSGMPSQPTLPGYGLMVAFCGDGANDVEALRAAHVGVSLCEAEASVAAPMTSRTQSISAMKTVMLQGRSLLTGVYQIFQFISCYAMVQAISVNLVYSVALSVGVYMYLIQDLFFTTVLGTLMGYTKAAKRLSKQKLVDGVLNPSILTPTIMQLIVVVGFQFASLGFLQSLPGYEKYRPGPDQEPLEEFVAPESTVLYLMGLWQFVTLALVLNKGRPHRQPMHRDYLMVVALVLQTGFVIYSVLSVDDFTEKVQQLVDKAGYFDMQARGKFLGLLAANTAAAYVFKYIGIGIMKLLDIRIV